MEADIHQEVTVQEDMITTHNQFTLKNIIMIATDLLVIHLLVLQVIHLPDLPGIHSQGLQAIHSLVHQDTVQVDMIIMLSQ